MPLDGVLPATGGGIDVAAGGGGAIDGGGGSLRNRTSWCAQIYRECALQQQTNLAASASTIGAGRPLMVPDGVARDVSGGGTLDATDGATAASGGGGAEVGGGGSLMARVSRHQPTD